MHILRCLFVLVLPLTVLAAANPRAGTSIAEYAKEKRREQLREMELRAKHPEWVPDKRQLSLPSNFPTGPCKLRRSTMTKRAAESDDVEQVLSPQEAAMFLVGQGSFVSDNGTEYFDHHWSSVQGEARGGIGNFIHHRLYKGIVNAVGHLLVEVTIPAFSKFMDSEPPEKLYYFTPRTSVRMGDMDDLVAELLNHPGMDELQVGTLHVTRRWLEAVQAFRRK